MIHRFVFQIQLLLYISSILLFFLSHFTKILRDLLVLKKKQINIPKIFPEYIIAKRLWHFSVAFLKLLYVPVIVVY